MELIELKWEACVLVLYLIHNTTITRKEDKQWMF